MRKILIENKLYNMYFIVLTSFAVLFLTFFYNSQKDYVNAMEKTKSQNIKSETLKFNSTPIYKESVKVQYSNISNEVTAPIPTEVEEKQNIVTPVINLVTVDIPEGLNVYELYELFDNNQIVDKNEFLEVVKDENFYNQLREEYNFLPAPEERVRFLFEGYLMGGKYSLPEKFSAKELIEKMVMNTNETLLSLKQGMTIQTDKNYSLSELITLASIVEQESNVSKDRRKIAGVFVNRLNQGIKLQSDVTVLYAQAKGFTKIYSKDLKIKSLYNTYYVEGVPIGPIASPSLDSLKAVFNPDKNNYLFFVGTGINSIFSSTYEEHKRNISKHL